MPTDLSVWLYSCLAPESPVRREIAGCLAKNGLSVHLVNDYNHEVGPGILLADRISPAIFPEISKACQSGERRVLLLCLELQNAAGPEAWQALQHGASDLLGWQPEIAREIKTRFERWKAVDDLVASPLVSRKMVGGSQVWKLALRQIVEAACYTQEPVLLTGETGTGKELAANLIHSLDTRRSKYDLVVLDCTTIVPDLSGSELFGHERGAFTGAISARDGAFAVADRGVLFLDEVGELPLGLQVQLLRVLQERTYKRVGSNSWHATDFRLVCATNRDLQHEVMRGRFRRDLYYRLASWKIHLPPLSERKEDILPLVYHYLQDGQAEGNCLTLDQAVEAYLVSRSYPGNVRDLKNLTLRLKARSAGSGRITLGDIPYEDRPEQNREPEGKAVDPDTTQAVPQADAVGAPTVSSDTAIGQEQVVEFIRQVLASGSTWDEILQSFQSAAAQVAKEITGGDEIAAGRRLGRDERTIKRWANGNRRNGKHGVNTDTQDG